MNGITITPESYRTSKISPIILSESQRVQIVFDSRQVDNLHDLKKNIKGSLIIKKKTKEIESFEEISKFSKKDISSKEYIEIALDTDETYELAKGLYDRYRLLSGKTTNPYEETIYVEQDEKIERIKRLLEDKENLFEIVSQIDVSALNTALNIENLRRAKAKMMANMLNDKENGFWQQFFEENSWVLAQIFHAPVMFFKGKRYVGGKGLGDHGGQYTDLTYKSDITDNVALIEIKSPVKQLLGKSYRQSFSVSEELSGGINQLLKQKETLYTHYATLLYESDIKFEANNIECVLVIGNVSELPKDQQRTFEAFRNELRSIRVIGFDELLQKIDNLLDLFVNH